MAAEEEEPEAAPIDPRGKQNKIKYKPPVITLWNKKKGPPSVLSRKNTRRMGFAKNANARRTSFLPMGLSSVSLTQRDNDSPDMSSASKT